MSASTKIVTPEGYIHKKCTGTDRLHLLSLTHLVRFLPAKDSRISRHHEHVRQNLLTTLRGHSPNPPRSHPGPSRPPVPPFASAVVRSPPRNTNAFEVYGEEGDGVQPQLVESFKAGEWLQVVQEGAGED